MLIHSTEHKEIVGSANGEPYRVLFDEDGYAEVDEAVGEQLLQLQAATLVPEPLVDSNDVVDIEKFNPFQLKKYAKDKGIDIGDATKKVELLEKIKATTIVNGEGGDE